ncbi:MAG: MlaD family protein [Planctomycetaceae bacterium]
MNDRVVALRVGLVLLAAGFITGFLIILLGEGKTYLQSRYTVHVKFPQAPGVTVDTPIRKNGVLIGRVTFVELRDEGGVVITARIDSGRKIFKDEICRIATSSLLGDSVLEFFPSPERNQPHEPFQDGDFLGDGIVAADPIRILTNMEGDVRRAISSFQTAADSVSTLSARLQSSFGTDNDQLPRLMQKTELALDQFQRTMGTVEGVIGDPELTAKLKEGLSDFPQTLKDLQSTMATARDTMDGFRGMQQKAERNLDNIERFTKPLGERGDELVGSVNSILKNIDTMTSTVADLADRIQGADGSLAKLIRDDELYNKIYATVDNLHDVSRRIRPILDDVRVFTDKIATDPRQLGVKGALDRRPSGTGIKGVSGFREPRLPWQEAVRLPWQEEE